MPAFLIDECVSFQTVRLFKTLGFPVKTVHDITLRQTVLTCSVQP